MKVTVFTPTYNRAYIIHNLYESLKRQSCKDFEWLVVDDGSSDDTEALFSKWQKEEYGFPIRYYKQPNGGKHRAINRGLDLAQGELFFTVDSDDYLTDDAVGKVIDWEQSLPGERKYCGVAGNLGTALDKTSNSLFREAYFDGSALDRYRNIDGERAMVFYTDVHRKYKYPEFSGENFMTEAVAWNRMANDGYWIRFYNDIIWIYEYKEDGLTKAGSAVFLNNPTGYGLWLRERAAFLEYGYINKLKMLYTFMCDLLERYSIQEIAYYINAPQSLLKLLYFCRRIIGVFR